MLSLASGVLIASVALGAESGDSLLPEYGELVVGRWMADITLIADYPGVGKKGEKVVGHGVTRWAADRRGLESDWFGGPSAGKSLAFWDPAAKRIMQYGVDSGGNIVRFEIWKEGERWVFQCGEVLPDGSKTEGKGNIVVKDGGNTVVYEGTFTQNGEKLLPLHDVYKRVGE